MGQPTGDGGEPMLAHQRGVKCRRARRHEDDAVDLAQSQLLDRVFAERVGWSHAVDDALQNAESVRFQIRLEVACQGLSGEMRMRPAAGSVTATT